MFILGLVGPIELSPLETLLINSIALSFILFVIMLTMGVLYLFKTRGGKSSPILLKFIKTLLIVSIFAAPVAVFTWIKLDSDFKNKYGILGF